MPHARPSDTDPVSLEAQNRALRAEIQHLRQDQATAAELLALTDRYKQTQVRFRTVFDHSPLGQKIIAADLTIRHANAAVVALLGLTHTDELVGRTILEFAAPQHRADWLKLQASLWEHNTPYFMLETCLVRPNGTSFWCQVTSVLFPDEEGELGYTTLVDIDDRKQLELSLKRLYDAQETIMYLVAHDLKTPITHIQMLVELLRRDAARLAPLPSGEQGEHSQFLTLIEQACAEASHLLGDVLYLGELDAKPLVKYHADLNAFLTRLLPVHCLAAQAKGIALTLELPPSTVHANVNPDQLSRALGNLLTNALKFTPPGGRVVVRLERRAGRGRLTVQDTGIGIPAEAQAFVFDKFGSAARPGLAGESGTGLGLFITQQIVRLHGGRIWLESRENEGTRFIIDLR